MNNIKKQGRLLLLIMLTTPILALCQGQSSSIKSGYAKFKEELYPASSIKNGYAKFEEELYPSSRIKNGYTKFEEELYPASSIKNGYAKFEEELYPVSRKEGDYSKFEEEFYASSKDMVEEAISLNSIKILALDKYKSQLEVKAAIAKMLENSNVQNEKILIMILLNNASELIVAQDKDKVIEGFIHEELKYKLTKN